MNFQDDQKIWQDNYLLLKKLEPGQKLMVVNGSQLEIDDRYLRWIRRRLTRNGPSELIEPITKTFDNVTDPYVNVATTLKHLQLVFRSTYHDDQSGLLKCVDDLYTNYKNLTPKSSNLLFDLLDKNEYQLYCEKGSSENSEKKYQKATESKSL